MSEDQLEKEITALAEQGKALEAEATAAREISDNLWKLHSALLQKELELRELQHRAKTDPQETAKKYAQQAVEEMMGGNVYVEDFGREIIEKAISQALSEVTNQV